MKKAARWGILGEGLFQGFFFPRLRVNIKSRHCERSEAIQKMCATKKSLDCFASLAMTPVFFFALYAFFAVNRVFDSRMALRLSGLREFF
ncbi:MAG: hypothetical protein FWC35_08340 [Proteobacteria bacterium]|nr:hypothetical protein [Pseudomonadota bacterium]